ncbi:MAG: hypothetical protein J6Y14_01310 [Fibrobacter sp.]|nr:hypothetical protein [Fibrobacter sp.]
MKKNKSVAQKILTNSFACIALLAGCAGFTEDGNTSWTENDASFEIAERFAAARVTQSGYANIDEVSDSLTVFLEVLGGCLKRGESFVFNPNYYFVDKQSFAYKFRNDTLLLSYYYEDKSTKEVDTGILVGGSSGILDGTWLMTQCMYVNDEYGCGNEGYNKYLKIDGNKVEFRADDRADYDYMNSVFVSDLFDFFDKANIDLRVNYVFYGSRVVGARAEKYGITIQEKTNKSMKFTYDNHEFDLNLKYARYRDSVSVSLKSGETTCVGVYSVKHDVPPELCRDENAEYLQHSRYDSSESEALRYERSNSEKFEDCLNGILGREKKSY